MKKTEVLPNLLTLCNALCGFGAIVYLAGDRPNKFWTASFLILGALVAYSRIRTCIYFIYLSTPDNTGIAASIFHFKFGQLLR